MSMRSIYLRPKIYDHRLKTLSKENGFEENEESFIKAYETIAAAIEPVVYYEYNFPAQSFMTAVLLPKDTSFKVPDIPVSDIGFDIKYAKGILRKELINDIFRLLNDWVSRERCSSLGSIEYIEGEEKEVLLAKLKERWQNLPAGLFEDGALLSYSVVFKTKLGLRPGCSGGGSCSSCTHPTCGYRST